MPLKQRLLFRYFTDSLLKCDMKQLLFVFLRDHVILTDLVFNNLNCSKLTSLCIPNQIKGSDSYPEFVAWYSKKLTTSKDELFLFDMTKDGWGILFAYLL